MNLRRAVEVCGSLPAATRRGWLAAVAAALVVLMIAGVVLAVGTTGAERGVLGSRPTSGTEVVLQPGTTYDAKDLPTVLANTDTVFVGTVLKIGDRDENAAWTTFDVAVVETLAGQPAEHSTVRQHGYVDRKGTVHIVESQSLVEVDRTYLFATKVEPTLDVYTTAPGPWAARAVESGEQRNLVQQYRDAR